MTPSTDFREYADTGLINHLAEWHLVKEPVHPPLKDWPPVRFAKLKVWLSRALRALGVL